MVWQILARSSRRGQPSDARVVSIPDAHPLIRVQRAAADWAVATATTAAAKDCFEAVNLTSQMPASGHRETSSDLSQQLAAQRLVTFLRLTRCAPVRLDDRSGRAAHGVANVLTSSRRHADPGSAGARWPGCSWCCTWPSEPWRCGVGTHTAGRRAWPDVIFSAAVGAAQAVWFPVRCPMLRKNSLDQSAHKLLIYIDIARPPCGPRPHTGERGRRENRPGEGEAGPGRCRGGDRRSPQPSA